MSHFNVNQYEAILEVVKANDGVIADDHGQGRTLKIAGIAILRRANEERGVVVPLIETKVGFCLNNLYLQEGQVHVSRNSVGGLIENGKHADLKSAVEAFNADQVDNQWTMGSLERIAYL
jgi:hypothetical protein